MTPIRRAQDQLFDAGSSAREKYASLVVGRPGWAGARRARAGDAAVAARAGSARPGAAQDALSAAPRVVRPQRVFGQNVVLRHPHKIRIGDNVVIDDNCLIDAKGDANRGITIGSGVFIGRNTILSCKNGDIDARRRRQHRLQLRDLLRQHGARRPRHADRRVLLPDWRRSRLLRSVAADRWRRRGVERRDRRRRRVARRRRQDPRRRHDRRPRDRRRRGGRARSGARRARSPSASRRIVGSAMRRRA